MCGEVGAGKSSLLAALLGELQPLMRSSAPLEGSVELPSAQGEDGSNAAEQPQLQQGGVNVTSGVGGSAELLQPQITDGAQHDGVARGEPGLHDDVVPWELVDMAQGGAVMVGSVAYCAQVGLHSVGGGTGNLLQ